ncbi:hypothetical protein SETIT_2G335200v2 [Setaria italica]|uniref:Uncharacterized protein n=2 Tax=Setaria TaxID=4554 RepID=A0A368Q662_SETIT|nr:hypothetical protein SETIT_2G335200v2 [Setaria italica]TKW35050.1 hypothetical protein SEVIR_2G345700v2 [Setaria viridis]
MDAAGRFCIAQEGGSMFWALELRSAVLDLEQAAAPFHAMCRRITWRRGLRP